MATFEDPVIYILSLFQERFMSGTWSNLFAAMEEDAQVSPPIESVAELRLRMNTKKPTAILVIDAGITQPRFETVLNELVEYTKSGGTVVCCCNFTGDLSSSGRPFFSNWDLPWDFSQYCRHSVILTATAASGLSQSNISQLEQTTFRYKLTSLVDVLPEHSLYKSGDIQTETRNGVLIPSDPRETVVAYAPVGRGYLGYVGDANNLDFSSKAIMAMCRLPVEAFVPEPQDERYTLHWTEDGNFQATPSMGTSSTLSSGFGRDAQNYQFTFGQSDPAVIYTSATTNYAGSSRYNQPGPSASTSGRRARPREAEFVTVRARAAKRAAVRQRKLDEAESYKEQGNDCFKRGQYCEAIVHYRQAIKVRGPQPAYLTNVAAAYLKLHMYDQAQETCEEALKYDPKNVKARFRRGMAHRDMFMFREALTDLKACAKLVPDDPQMEEEMQITKRMSDERRQAGHKDEYIGCICGPQYINDEDMEEDHWMFEPGLDEIPERIPAGDDSDSSDFEHKGNGNPCRSYNRDGCQNGGPKKCRFRHAPPKEGTTRDELGRNVCNRWLLSGCTKGNSCPYAHSKEYLPEEGWWTAGEQFEAMKDVMSTLNMIQGMSPAALSAYERRLDMGSFYDDDDDDFY